MREREKEKYVDVEEDSEDGVFIHTVVQYQVDKGRFVTIQFDFSVIINNIFCYKIDSPQVVNRFEYLTNMFPRVGGNLFEKIMIMNVER